jgi:DNA-binding transcriptional MerR regulator
MSVDTKPLPAIPAKRYFTIGEVSELCGVKAYVLRYWEQEFTQLKPMKRRGNRRYYQHHEVLLIRRIRDLLYEQGFTISGARNQLTDIGAHALTSAPADEPLDPDGLGDESIDDTAETLPMPLTPPAQQRDPGTRSRASDAAVKTGKSAKAVVAAAGEADMLDDAALEAMAREDLATIARARQGVGEFAPTTTSVAVGSAGVRAAALETRRSTHGSAAPAPNDAVYTPEQIRAELLAIRSLLVS